MQAQIDFLACDLGCQDAGWQVGDLVLRIVPHALGHQARKESLELFDAGTGLGGDHEDVGIDARFIELLRHGQQIVPVDHVDLVERQDRLAAGLVQPVDHALVVLDHALVAALGTAMFEPGPRAGIDDMHDGIGILGAAPGGRHHRLVQPPLGREHAGRVHQHDLAAALQRHAAHGETGRLDLVGDDGDLLADQGIDQGRLAGIGRTDDRGKAAAGLGRIRHAVLRVREVRWPQRVRRPVWNRPRRSPDRAAKR